MRFAAFTLSGLKPVDQSQVKVAWAGARPEAARPMASTLRLSKSKFTPGLQCDKQLWWCMNVPSIVGCSTSTQRTFGVARPRRARWAYAPLTVAARSTSFGHTVPRAQWPQSGSWG